MKKVLIGLGITAAAVAAVGIAVKKVLEDEKRKADWEFIIREALERSSDDNKSNVIHEPSEPILPTNIVLDEVHSKTYFGGE